MNESQGSSQTVTRSISSLSQRPIWEYGVAVQCWCGAKAPMWTSWTNNNPGRRFHSCATPFHCNFHSWVDEIMSDRAKEVIVGLREREKELDMVNRKVKSDIRRMRLTNEGLAREKLGFEKEAEELRLELEEVKTQNEELRFKNKLLEGRLCSKKFSIKWLFAFVVVVFFVMNMIL